jgi:hypothetical protein
MGRLIGVVIAALVGVAIGAFIPGPGSQRSWVWLFAGAVITTSAYLGYHLTTITQRVLGRWTGSAAVIITTSALAVITALTPAGCGSCTTAQLQSWAGAGLMFGLSLVTWSLLKALTSGVVSATKTIADRNGLQIPRRQRRGGSPER